MKTFQHSLTRSITPALLTAVSIGTWSSTANAAAFEQGFETDTAGWSDFGGTVTRVASGAGSLGVTSADGSYHAEIQIGPNAGNGGFTNFGGYGDTWPGQIVQSLDVYIDPNAGTVGDGWYLDNAVNDSNGDWTEAGGVGALKATGGNWWITADADGAAYQGPAAGGVGLEITQAGWYTIVSEWNANGDGTTVDRDTFIYDSSGTELYSNLNPQQVALADIGGTRYGWFAATDGTTLTMAVDNSSLVVPEPGSLALLGLGGLALARRRRRV